MVTDPDGSLRAEDDYSGPQNTMDWLGTRWGMSNDQWSPLDAADPQGQSLLSQGRDPNHPFRADDPRASQTGWQNAWADPSGNMDPYSPGAYSFQRQNTDKGLNSREAWETPIQMGSYMLAPWAGAQIGGALGMGAMGSGAMTGAASSIINGGNPMTGALTGGAFGAYGNDMDMGDYTYNAEYPGGTHEEDFSVEETPYQDDFEPAQGTLTPEEYMHPGTDWQQQGGLDMAQGTLSPEEYMYPSHSNETPGGDPETPWYQKMGSKMWGDITENPWSAIKYGGMGALMIGNALSQRSARKTAATNSSAAQAAAAARQAAIDNPLAQPGGQNFGFSGTPQPLARTKKPFNDPLSYFMNYGRGPERQFYDNVNPVARARGGLTQEGGLSMMHDSAVAHPYVQGVGGGQDDKVPARLSPKEYVFDADTVASLGDGNPDEGARKLDLFRTNIRRHKRSAPASSIPPKAKRIESYLSRRAA